MQAVNPRGRRKSGSWWVRDVIDRPIHSGTLVRMRRSCLTGRILLCGILWLSVGPSPPSAHADPLYSITDLGTLSGQSSSVATSINNSGQVVGISYNSSDGYFTQILSGSAQQPRFTATGSGAASFLYSSGRMTQISPVGGLATSINNSGQVVGGQYSSINDSGQYVGSAFAGVILPNDAPSQLVSGSATVALPAQFAAIAINNSGVIAGLLTVDAHGGSNFDPAIYQNGQVTDLISKIGLGTDNYDGRAIAINQHGDVLITVQQYTGAGPGSQTGPVASYLYNASTGQLTNLTALAGTSGMIGAALNNKDQVVGNGFLYSDGTIQLLNSLISPTSGWSNLNATAINDSGQIVGQGLFNGQEQAFEMTPVAAQVPEPTSIACWCLGAAGALIYARKPRRKAAWVEEGSCCVR